MIVSAGPFRIEKYRPGQDLTLARNERYWGEPSFLDRIVLRFTSDAEWLPAFRNGEVDVLRVTDPTDDLLAQLKTLPGARHRITSGLGQQYIGFNFRNEFLAIREVRRAVALAIDRRTVTERSVGRDAEAKVVNSFLFGNDQPGYRDTSGGRFERADVAEAKRLLEGAGFVMGSDGTYGRDGKRLSFRLRSPSEGKQVEAQLIQAHARQAGIDLRLDAAPFNLLIPQLNRGDFDIEVINYGKTMWGIVNQFRPGNRWAYPNLRPNELIQQSTRELDDQKRWSLLHEADTMLWEDLPILPLYQRPQLTVWRDSVVNIEPNVNGSGLVWNVAVGPEGQELIGGRF